MRELVKAALTTAGILTLIMAGTLFAQSPNSADWHPSALHRPIIEPSYAVLPDGTIRQEWSVSGLEALDQVALPALRSTVRGEPQTQGVVLKGFPAGSAWNSYTVRVTLVSLTAVDDYSVENLTGESFGAVPGQSAYLARLRMDHPTVGLQLHAPSVFRAWNLAAVHAWDGTLDWLGTSGERNTTSFSLSNASTTITQYPHLTRFLRDELRVYVAPTLGSTFHGWPAGVRYDMLRREPLAKGPSSGHGWLWPWAHRAPATQVWRVEYVPQ